jgi:hypothetical protein
MKTKRSTLALAAASALLLLLTWTGPARAAGPSDALVATLRDAPAPVLPFELATRYDVRERHIETWLSSTSPVTPAAFVAMVTPECRAETRRGAAPEAAAAARAWTRRGDQGSIDRGRILLCAMQDPAALADLPAWMADDDHAEARAVCASALATWPEANAVRARVLPNALRRHRGNWPDNWEVDPAIVAAANVLGPPELREQLVPVLEMARARRASGHDRLRVALCTDDETTSIERTRACSAPAETERDWGRARSGHNMKVAKVGIVVCYAGLVAATYSDRTSEDARKTATVGGVIGGAMLGSALLTGVVGYKTQDTVEAGAAGLAGMVVGGVLGGVAAHALAASPGARTPITAVGFAPIPLFVLIL